MNVNQVTVVENWSEVMQAYQVVGKATIYRNAGGVLKADAINRMREIAAEMGADGVVGLQGNTSFRSALAVKWLAPGVKPKPVTTPFIVALLPVKEGANSRGNPTTIGNELRTALFLAIEPKGYFLLPNYVSDFSGGIDQARKLDAAALQDVGGKDSHLILEVGFASRSELNLGVYNQATAELYAKLLDKQSGKLIFEGWGKGTGSSQFFADPVLSVLEEVAAHCRENIPTRRGRWG